MNPAIVPEVVLMRTGCGEKGDESEVRLLFRSLIRYGSCFPTDLIGIPQKIVFCQIQMVVELENIGNGRRKIQTYDLVVRNPFQVLDDAAQAVAVCDDQKLILKLQMGENGLFPIGKDPFDRVFQRFGTG